MNLENNQVSTNQFIDYNMQPVCQQKIVSPEPVRAIADILLVSSNESSECPKTGVENTENDLSKEKIFQHSAFCTKEVHSKTCKEDSP
mmetsp:Transcript_24962/g.27634  ORF Transcript_24962/g.27634 Transcript_24962/m.27634 type:complete len:88 (+) Transcript_24962:178-441(+)